MKLAAMSEKSNSDCASSSTELLPHEEDEFDGGPLLYTIRSEGWAEVSELETENREVETLWRESSEVRRGGWGTERLGERVGREEGASVEDPHFSPRNTRRRRIFCSCFSAISLAFFCEPPIVSRCPCLRRSSMSSEEVETGASLWRKASRALLLSALRCLL